MIAVLEEELTIRGYDVDGDVRLVDANALLARPEFWHEYVLSAGRCEVTDDEFGAAGDEQLRVRQALQDGSRWAVLSMLAGAGQWLRVVYRNFDGDAGIDFLIDAEWCRAVQIAAVEGSFRGPGICWEELSWLAGMPDPDLTFAQRLVLALPMLGDNDLPPNAQQVVAAALRDLGARSATDDLAAQLLAAPGMWAHDPWAIIHGVRMCLGRHAPRHMQTLSLLDLHRVDAAFGGEFVRNRQSSLDFRFGRAGRTAPRWRFEVRESQQIPGRGLAVFGRLDGELRNGEPALLVHEQKVTPIQRVRAEFARINGVEELALHFDGVQSEAPLDGAVILPADHDMR